MDLVNRPGRTILARRSSSTRACAQKVSSPILAVGGEVDIVTVESLQKALLDAQRSPRVIVDLSEVTFMDSAGINALVAAYHRVPADGELRLIGLRANVRRVFEITGLLELFRVDPSDDSPSDPVES